VYRQGAVEGLLLYLWVALRPVRGADGAACG
jgi:hypothetical protein